jgi:hypothetical protein
MATVLEGCATEEQCSFARFLWAKGLNAKDTHKEMFPVYSDKCLSHKAVYSWIEKFSQECLKIADGARLGCPVEIMTAMTVQRVEELI